MTMSITMSITSAASVAGRATRPLLRTLGARAMSTSQAEGASESAGSDNSGPRFQRNRRAGFRPRWQDENGDVAFQRRPRPVDNHFTTRPELMTIIETLQAALREGEAKLRQQYILPLPRGLPKVPVPKYKWLPRESLAFTMRTDQDYGYLVGTLGALARMRQIAKLANQHDVAQRLADVIAPFEQGGMARKARQEEEAALVAAAEGNPVAEADAVAAGKHAAASSGVTQVETKQGEQKDKKVKKGKRDLDEYGRAYAIGRRKTSSARVWLVPTQAQRSVQDSLTKLDAAQKHLTASKAREAKLADKGSDEERRSARIAVEEANEAVDEAAETFAQLRDSTGPPSSEILVNHLPLPQFFGHVDDREKVLRPLRLTGLLGAYNVFALVRGGGTTGQKDAVALGIARALQIMRPESREVLYNAGLLFRDARIVERKKTNRPKARKRVSTSWFVEKVIANGTVHLGQALSFLLSAPNLISHALHWTAQCCVALGRRKEHSVAVSGQRDTRKLNEAETDELLPTALTHGPGSRLSSIASSDLPPGCRRERKRGRTQLWKF
ncbi:hypothetical protein A1Q2_07821 [Trichosporon asahii var. asahii CBS 8904]|uniref:Uncharacterized protein n=1 Tax=Trichosporon asahii var. asahii (strain CBS 8904) TaxID=1220162 RepID=K1W843_TRIAC|nr:hypothetical protein A1Q2_07821 [Trichosporon asahii var. asahii CBS 8904]